MNRNFLFAVIIGIVVTMIEINRQTEEIAMTTPKKSHTKQRFTVMIELIITIGCV